MKIYHHLNEFKKLSRAVVTIGTFDGVHFGHQKIIARLVQEAKAIQAEVVILTFFPHPRMILHPEDQHLKLINTINEKALLLERFGVNHLIITPFTRDFSNLWPQQYIEQILVNTIGTTKIIIGHNHHFGKDRSGNISELQKYAPQYGYQVIEIPQQEVENSGVSSTKIRNALLNSDVDTANQYMGHPFTINGKVIRGDQIGRTMGYPTANIFIDESYKLIPSDGIYAVKVYINTDDIKNKNQEIKNPYTLNNSYLQHSHIHKNAFKSYLGMAYIGHRPTINGMSQNIEVNIFDFNSDIYHQTIKIEFLHFIRHDIKFDGLAALTQQLGKDKEIALAYFKQNI
ncbi:MAG: bifunctional riboflavin kinase/FAD synthetase [Sphingobacteriales bacterium]|nr:MAG: bifunctional riboflavin kinase/FAD synthetase [Sphingobacteriales bacterium]TAF80156.1 MAG: bifunctional riboflavin kinase/FAD synthetase [Sphingobacteriales bacterium]